MTQLQIHGIITALLTPINDTLRPDKDMIQNLITFQLENDVQSFFVLGTTGEGPSFSIQDRKTIAELFRDVIPSKGIMIIHVGSTSIDDCILLAKHAKDIGADAISAIGPYFYGADEQGLIKFYETLSCAVDLPLIVYNNTKKQGYNISPKIFGSLIERCSTIVGIKDTSYNHAQLLELVTNYKQNYTILGSGDTMMFDAFALGVHGHVSAISNIFPAITKGLYKAILEGNFEIAKKIQLLINNLRHVLKSFKLEISPYKAALKYHGIDVGTVLPPLRDLTHDEEESLIKELSKLDITYVFDL